jgi:hypothetical protein
MPTEGVEFYLRHRRALIACNTNDSLTFVGVGCPSEEFFTFRMDMEGHYFKSLALAPLLLERVRSGKQEGSVGMLVEKAKKASSSSEFTK